MASKRITKVMADEAAKVLCQPIADRIEATKDEIKRVILEAYNNDPLYAELETVNKKHPGYMFTTNRVLLMHESWVNEVIIRGTVFICDSWSTCKLNVPREVMDRIDGLKADMQITKKELSRIGAGFEKAIYMYTNLKKLSEGFPEAYEVLKHYDTELPTNPANTALAVNVEPLLKTIKKYEKANKNNA